MNFSQNGKSALDEANRLYLIPNPTEEQELKAMELYKEVLNETPDSWLVPQVVEASERLGNLQLSFGMTQAAQASYRKGIDLNRAFSLSDSSVFLHHLYLGEAYFGLNRLDSSLYFLEAAERIQNHFGIEEEKDRLYNALGVYFYETGNFNRAYVYFSKAESFLIGQEGGALTYARYSFRSNMASALYKLEKYDSAQSMYRELLDLGINLNQVRMNLANTFIEQGKASEALAVLIEIEKEFANQSLSFNNLQAKAYLQLKRFDEFHETLSLGSEMISKGTFPKQNFQLGIHFGLWADFWAAEKQWTKALESVQQGLTFLHPEFEQLDIRANPTDFVLGVSVLSLYDILAQKAEIAWKAYSNTGEERFFQLGMETWDSAFALVRFISANYENDEARVFLGDQAFRSYQKAINNLTTFAIAKGSDELIKKAFVWIEESKAEGLINGNRLQAQKRKAGLPEELIQEEQNLLFSISRNYQKQLDETESLDVLEKERVDLQVRLSRLREKFRSFPKWELPEAQRFDFEHFRAKLSNQTAALSLFISDSYLYVFWIESEEFRWKRIELENFPLLDLQQWTQDIRTPGFADSKLIQQSEPFANLIFEGFRDRLSAIAQLVIIPHGIFNAVPFEVFSLEDQHLLLDNTSVIYQFSARFIDPIEWERAPEKKMGFAPFLEVLEDNSRGFLELKESKLELESFDQETFFGESATRDQFLRHAGEADILHLATHAVAAPSDPNQSFVAFHPSEEEFRVFVPEISSMDLNQVKLVYLSACETGAGKQSLSEGFVSLARSFAIAGAEQMVLTQWVSEDRVSAYLAGRFYQYLDEGDSPANSLRKAKLDLLNDPQMVQFHHPFYWSNFRLIGQPIHHEVSVREVFGIIGALLVLTGLVLAAWIWIRSKLG